MNALTPGQRAAATRAANRAGGGSVSNASSERPAGLILDLVISIGSDQIEISFRATGPDGASMNGSLGPDNALPFLRWSGYRSEGELITFRSCGMAHSGNTTGASMMELVLPLMKRVDRFINLAIDQSEDDSFAFIAASLATHFRASRIIVRNPDFSETEHKRGAVYVTAHKAVQTFLAS